jgi:hypothetical protein
LVVSYSWYIGAHSNRVYMDTADDEANDGIEFEWRRHEHWVLLRQAASVLAW